MSGLDATERAVGKYAGASFAQKEKEQGHQFRVPDYEGEESQGGREPHLGERQKEGRFQGDEEGQTRRAPLGEVEGSMSG